MKALVYWAMEGWRDVFYLWKILFFLKKTKFFFLSFFFLKHANSIQAWSPEGRTVADRTRSTPRVVFPVGPAPTKRSVAFLCFVLPSRPLSCIHFWFWTFTFLPIFKAEKTRVCEKKCQSNYYKRSTYGDDRTKGL